MTTIPDGLPTIGKATIILLRQNGFETAMSLIEAGSEGHARVPGVGPAKWAVLLDWAQGALTFDQRASPPAKLRSPAPTAFRSPSRMRTPLAYTVFSPGHIGHAC